MADKKLVAAVEQIESRMFLILGHKVMLDADLAELYGVPTKALNQAVKRNAERFPDEFMFQLTAEEFARQDADSTVNISLTPSPNTARFASSCHLPIRRKNV